MLMLANMYNYVLDAAMLDPETNSSEKEKVKEGSVYVLAGRETAKRVRDRSRRGTKKIPVFVKQGIDFNPSAATNV
jgi:hypothetical protein